MSGWWVTLYCEDTLYASIESYQTVWLWFLFVICCENYEPENKNEDDVGDRNSDDNDGGDKETFEVEIDREEREEDGGWDCYDHYLQHGQHQPGKQKTAENVEIYFRNSKSRKNNHVFAGKSSVCK